MTTTKNTAATIYHAEPRVLAVGPSTVCEDREGAIDATVEVAEGLAVEVTLLPAHSGYRDRDRWVTWGDRDMWLAEGDADLPDDVRDALAPAVTAAAHAKGMCVTGEVAHREEW
jgi:hypothetical protein